MIINGASLRGLISAAAAAVISTSALAGDDLDIANRAKGIKAAPAAANASAGMALLGATVASDGSTLSSAGVVSSEQIGGFPGNYEIIFNRNVASCIYSASGARSEIYTIYAQPRAGQQNGVFVRLRGSNGSDLPSQFYLTVFCPR